MFACAGTFGTNGPLSPTTYGRQSMALIPSFLVPTSFQVTAMGCVCSAKCGLFPWFTGEHFSYTDIP
jgi:hypothetical protein